MPSPEVTLRPLPSHRASLPRLPEPPFRRAAPTTPADRAGAHVDCFPAHAAFARRIAQPPKATFVTRLQPFRLPDRAARQLPDQSTTLRVDSSSTDDSRLRGALPCADQVRRSKECPYSITSSARASSVAASILPIRLDVSLR